jgi:hypothetical protein
METYVDRLKEELKEVSERKGKLIFFIDSKRGNFKTLSKIKQYLLRRQLDVMNEYESILEARLSAEGVECGTNG